MGTAPVLLPSLFERYLYLNGASAQRWIQVLLTTGFLIGVVALCGLLDAWSPFVGLLALALAFTTLLTLGKKSEILALDRPNGKYRIYNAFYGLQFGVWQSLPIINRVVVKYFSEFSVAGRRSWQVISRQQSYIVLLSVPAPHKAIIIGKFSAREEAEALLFANEAAAYLGVDTYVFDR